jgi:ankyrin repeat protein
LIIAVEKNNFEIVDLLLKNGASVINYDISALDYVTKETDKKIVKHLKKYKN